MKTYLVKQDEVAAAAEEVPLDASGDAAHGLVAADLRKRVGFGEEVEFESDAAA